MDSSATENSLRNNPTWTFVCVKKEIVWHAEEHGIAPVMQLLSKNPELLRDAWIEDRVVGKAAALLFVFGQIKSLHAELISEYAIEVLSGTKIALSYDRMVPYIMNRNKTGACPMEETVRFVNNPEIAYEMLQNKLRGGV